MNLLVKEQLSKLLATENINVEHADISTAQFNLETRTLTLPNWSESVSNDVYDLLTSHEVGHALYTPVKETKAILTDDKYPNIHFFINVVEDSRIERMIKNTYPGLKKNYHNGYKELYDQDFFKLKDTEIEDLPLIDRLNLNEKIGNFTLIKFSDEEHHFAERIKKTKTFKEVVELSKELYTYSKEEQYIKSMEDEVSYLESSLEDGDEDEDEFQINDKEYFKPKKDNSKTIKKIEKLKEKIEKFGDKKETQGLGAGDNNFSDFEPRAKTQENLEKSVENIIVSSDRKLYLQFPELNYKNFVYDYKKVYKLITEQKNNKLNKLDLIRIKKEVKKSVEYMIKVFETKKAASFYVRNKVAKTGTIDTSKLFSYKYNEDIFKKINIVPEGKNHGMVILFDWSGSMVSHSKLYNCFKQLVSTVLFCRKMNIPYRVFLFGCEIRYDYDNYNYVPYGYKSSSFNKNINYKNYDIVSDDNAFKIVEILNSEMNKKEYDTVMEYFATITSLSIGSYFSFGGTPLTEACHTIDYVIKEFKEQHNVEICNLLVITDGVNNLINNYRYNNHNDYVNGHLVLVRDNQTKKLYKAESFDVGMLQTKLNAIKDKHKCNVIGFFLGETYDINQIIYRYGKRSDSDDVKKQLKSKNCTTIFDCGYQEYHIVNVSSIGGQAQIADAKTTKGLATSFNKFLKKKNLNKIVLSKFVETISKQVV